MVPSELSLDISLWPFVVWKHIHLFFCISYTYIYISFSLPFVASWIPIRVVYYSMCRFVCESVCVLDSLSAFFSPLDFSTFIFSNQMTIPWGSVKWTFTLSYHLIVGRLWITIHSTEMDAFYFFEWLEWSIQSIKSRSKQILSGWRHVIWGMTIFSVCWTPSTPTFYQSTYFFDKQHTAFIRHNMYFWCCKFMAVQKNR